MFTPTFSYKSFVARTESSARSWPRKNHACSKYIIRGPCAKESRDDATHDSVRNAQGCDYLLFEINRRCLFAAPPVGREQKGTEEDRERSVVLITAKVHTESLIAKNACPRASIDLPFLRRKVSVLFAFIRKLYILPGPRD